MIDDESPLPVRLPPRFLNRKHPLFQQLQRAIRNKWARKALSYQSMRPQVLYLVVSCLELIGFEGPGPACDGAAAQLLRKIVPLDCCLYHFCVEWCDRDEQVSPDAFTYGVRQELLTDLRSRLRPQCQQAAALRQPRRNEHLIHPCAAIGWGLPSRARAARKGGSRSKRSGRPAVPVAA